MNTARKNQILQILFSAAITVAVFSIPLALLACN